MAWTNPKTWTVGELVTAANMNTHLRDNLNALDRGVLMARIIGVAGGFGERWHMAGQITSSPTGTVGLTVGRFVTAPLISPRGLTIDRISFNVTTAGAAGSVARAGIYQATSETDPWPSARIVDGGEIITTSTGVKTATVSVSLEPDILYWAVVLAGVAAPTISSIADGSVMNLFGSPPGFGVQAGWTRDQAYGTLPATFPAGPPTTAGGSCAAVALRYSA